MKKLYKKRLSLILSILLFFTFIPVNAVQAFADEVKSNMEERTEEAIWLLESTIDDGILSSDEELILKFDKNLRPGRNFNLIKLCKEVEEQEVMITTGSSITVNEIPLIIKVGLNENLISVASEQEGYFTDKKYSLYIPEGAFQDESGIELKEEINMEFMYVIKEKDQENSEVNDKVNIIENNEVHNGINDEVQIVNTNLADDGALTTWELTLEFNYSLESADIEGISISNIETGVNSEIKELSISYDRKRLSLTMDILKLPKNNRYILEIKENSLIFENNIQNNKLSMNFNTNCEEEQTCNITSTNFKEGNGKIALDVDSHISINVDKKIIFETNKEKIKLYEKIDDENTKAVEFGVEPCFNFNGVEIYSQLLENKEYTLIIENGAFLDLYGKEINCSDKYDFVVKKIPEFLSLDEAQDKQIYLFNNKLEIRFNTELDEASVESMDFSNVNIYREKNGTEILIENSIENISVSKTNNKILEVKFKEGSLESQYNYSIEFLKDAFKGSYNEKIQESIKINFMKYQYLIIKNINAHNIHKPNEK
jgi:hypothetical protein